MLPLPSRNDNFESYLLFVISVFRRGVNEIFALLGCYAALICF